jgi:acetyl esterase
VPLDPQAQAYLDKLAELGAPGFGEQPVAEARQAMEAGAADLFGPFESVPFEDRTLPGPGGPIPVRSYTPGDAVAPVLVFFHGGGWVLGSVRTHDGVCATLARLAGCSVLSVDYRLAPEHRFPAAVEDAWAAVEWAAANAPAVAVGGDSAGGNLAICALRARDRGLALALQLLVYPVLDADFDTRSYLDYADGYLLTRSGMLWFFDQYVPDGDRFQAEVSPLRAPELAGVAPALVLTAECDPLRDEGEAYAARLAESGVPATLSRYDGMIHGFFRQAAVVDRTQDALAEASAALRAAFAG